MNDFQFDKIVFSPEMVDLTRSPLRNGIDTETYVLGAFNPGLSRLPNGNLIMMVRIAEAIKAPIDDSKLYIIRFAPEEGFVIDELPAEDCNPIDPRKFLHKHFEHTKVFALTSLSWILPVELDREGTEVLKIHYDKVIYPQFEAQEYGIEDPRITIIDGEYYMTVCCVSTLKQSTFLYKSIDGINYENLGMIFDHQNKDVVLFPRLIGDKYYALTRPVGDHYFYYSGQGFILPGPSINLASSPDLLHWKPVEKSLIPMTINSSPNVKLGGGAPPVEFKGNWLVLFHGVEKRGIVGNYVTFEAILDLDDPTILKNVDMNNPGLTSRTEFTDRFGSSRYMKDVVFTTGIEENEDAFIVASGENDLCCRITHIPKDLF